MPFCPVQPVRIWKHPNITTFIEWEGDGGERGQGKFYREMVGRNEQKEDGKVGGDGKGTGK